jgi:hypothetical protein
MKIRVYTVCFFLKKLKIEKGLGKFKLSSGQNPSLPAQQFLSPFPLRAACTGLLHCTFNSLPRHSPAPHPFILPSSAETEKETFPQIKTNPFPISNPKRAGLYPNFDASSCWRPNPARDTKFIPIKGAPGNPNFINYRNRVTLASSSRRRATTENPDPIYCRRRDRSSKAPSARLLRQPAGPKKCPVRIPTSL